VARVVVVSTQEARIFLETRFKLDILDFYIWMHTMDDKGFFGSW